MKRLLIGLDDTLHEKLKRLAFSHHRSMSSIVREVLRVGLTRPIPEGGRRRQDMGRVAKPRSGRG